MAAATRKGKAIYFTALTDTYTGGVVDVAGITFRGLGLTATDFITLQDTSGENIADYVVEGATDNADLWNGRPPQFYHGLKIGTGSLATLGAGTFALTVFLN